MKTLQKFELKASRGSRVKIVVKVLVIVKFIDKALAKVIFRNIIKVIVSVVDKVIDIDKAIVSHEALCSTFKLRELNNNNIVNVKVIVTVVSQS